MYSLDTSFFMDWQARFYPIDLFPTLEKNIVGMIAAGTCGAVGLVKEEIDAVGTPGLRSWAASQSGLFLPMTPDNPDRGSDHRGVVSRVDGSERAQRIRGCLCDRVSEAQGLARRIPGNLGTREAPPSPELLHT